MFFKLGLLIGAALTIGLIAAGLLVGSDDQPAGTDPGQFQQQGPADPTGGQIANGIEAPDSAKNNPEAAVVDQGPGLLIIWSDQQQDRLTVSLQVDDPGISDCRFHLTVGDGPNTKTALAKVMDTPSQRGCIGHIEDAGQLAGPAQLLIEGLDQQLLISCRFDLRGESENANGRDLFWNSTDSRCIGNFNPQNT